MPVTKLMVEGELDAQVLNPVFAGRPVVEPAKSSKNALAPRVRTDRQKGQRGLHYLRDRDFDHPPPESPNAPVEDRTGEDGAVLGWRWARHELENYMLEPRLVTSALGVDTADYREALSIAAQKIRFYEAARWAVGLARAKLSPPVKLRTRPPEGKSKEFFLPKAMTNAEMREWARGNAALFTDRTREVLAPDAILASCDQHERQFSDDFCGDTASILLWFSGKDLMTALNDWLHRAKLGSPGDFRTAVRDWMIMHPKDVLSILPEWRALLDLVRT